MIRRFGGGLLALVVSLGAQAQCDRSTQAATAPSERFHTRADGTVIDASTGLMWQRCSFGQSWQDGECQATTAARSWGGALRAAEQSNFAGYDDWRVPNIKELQSLVEYACSEPALNTEIFADEPDGNRGYWSSTPEVGGSESRAWHLDFDEGRVYPTSKSATRRARFVRGLD